MELPSLACEKQSATVFVAGCATSLSQDSDSMKRAKKVSPMGRIVGLRCSVRRERSGTSLLSFQSPAETGPRGLVGLGPKHPVWVQRSDSHPEQEGVAGFLTICKMPAVVGLFPVGSLRDSGERPSPRPGRTCFGASFTDTQTFRIHSQRHNHI